MVGVSVSLGKMENLHSDEYKLKKSKLFEEKGISEGKMFEEMSENFIEYYKLQIYSHV